ncbi:hypothetical protein IZ6_09150 [Terrihabitans soli]|uniref:Uncharacterized protein n=1 Tax=Terrihabitans soli TaxID=708113 RepID=A0A6S6QTD0_9HYPH|nr:hypothetical protein [Terrihabitans soli]BCJ90180.1 hypothetical protein IZ6_09150 [Terrihabitans soli]
MGRLLWGALFLSLAFLAVLIFAEVEVPLDPEEAIRRELDEKITAPAIEAKIEAALARGDIDDAAMYAELATEFQRPIRTDLVERIKAETAAAPTAQRNAMEFGAGFFKGEGTTVAGLAGAVTSDLTVVGDVRDLVHEGGLMVSGQPYSEIILGLSTIGIVATGATVATGGGALPAKLGVSALKVAKKAGTLTAGLGEALGRALRQSVDFGELGNVLKAAATMDSAAVRDAAAKTVRRASDGDLARMIGDARHLGEVTGPGETVRLMKYANTPEELSELATMSTRFGRTTRGVVELTGRASLRAFKTGVRIVSVILENLYAFILWFGGIIGMIMTRSGWRAVRGRR